MKSVFKRTMSVILSVMLAFSVLTVAVSAFDEGDLVLYVATDTHYVPGTQLGDVDKAPVTVPNSDMYFYADYMGKMFYESEAIIRSLLSDFEASSSQFLIVSGDMTNNGDIAAHESIAAIFRESEQRSGKSILVVPGNHDVKTDDGMCDINEFKRIYADFGYNEALAKHDVSGSYTIDLSSKYRLLAIDSNDYDKVAGNITEPVMSFISEQVAKANEDGKYIIGTMHHSLLDHFELQSTFTGGFDTYSLSTLAKTFADWGIKYMLTGHLHVTDITVATTANGNKIYDVSTGSLISGDCNYRVMTFTDENVNIETKRIGTVDPAFLPDGYTDAQLDKLVNDFPTYSREYLSAGLYYWVDSFLNVEKFGDSLGVSEGSTAYNAIELLMSKIRTSVKLPLYDKAGTPELDSIEEIAQLSGYDIPDSDYESAIDIASKFVLGFFGGTGTIKSDSLETVILLEAIKGCIAYSLGQLIDDGEYADELFMVFTALGVPAAGLESGNVFTTELARLTYMQTAANAVVKTMIAPILDSISFDAYAPDDLNVTLESYTEKPHLSITGDGGQPLSFLQKLIAFLKYIYNVVMSGLDWLK